MPSDAFTGVLGSSRGNGQRTLPQYGDNGYCLEDGYSVQGYMMPEGVLEWPRQDGRICYRDNDGLLIESFYVDDPEWDKFAHYFSAKRADFQNVDLSELLRQADDLAEERNILTVERKKEKQRETDQTKRFEDEARKAEERAKLTMDKVQLIDFMTQQALQAEREEELQRRRRA